MFLVFLAYLTHEILGHMNFLVFTEISSLVHIPVMVEGSSTVGVSVCVFIFWEAEVNNAPNSGLGLPF